MPVFSLRDQRKRRHLLFVVSKRLEKTQGICSSVEIHRLRQEPVHAWLLDVVDGDSKCFCIVVDIVCDTAYAGLFIGTIHAKHSQQMLALVKYRK